MGYQNLKINSKFEILKTGIGWPFSKK